MQLVSQNLRDKGSTKNYLLFNRFILLVKTHKAVRVIIFLTRKIGSRILRTMMHLFYCLLLFIFSYFQVVINCVVHGPSKIALIANDQGYPATKCF